MADGVNVKDAAGTAVPVATDELSSGDYTGKQAQLIKLLLGADGAGVLASFGNGAADSGTFRVAIASDAPALSVSGAVTASGTAAHDAADSGNPLKIGGKARTSNPIAVADGDRVDAFLDKQGIVIVSGTLREAKGVQRSTIVSTTSESTVVTAGAAGVFRDVYMLMVTNISANAAIITIRDSIAGSIIGRLTVAALATVGWQLPVDGAVKQTTAANSWTITTDVNNASLDVTAAYVERL